MSNTTDRIAFEKHILSASWPGGARRYLCRTCNVSFEGSAEAMGDAAFRLSLYRIAVEHAASHEKGKTDGT